MFNRRKSEDSLSSATAPRPGEALPPLLPAEDNGLDVPQYRPVAPVFAPAQTHVTKDMPMARSPFSPPAPPGTPIRPAYAGAANPDAAERRTLVVGRGISVQGTVQDAERLVVEGTVEAAMINGLIELSIAQGGVFKGEVEVDEAEVAGVIDGTLTARHALIVRATGRVLGTAKCRRLQVEDGGQITGRIEMISTPGEQG